MSNGVTIGDDGRSRCWWPGATPELTEYHDEEWGRPRTDDHGLFETLTLESFQTGLAWITILRKRDRFRAQFAYFDFAEVAVFDDNDVERLLDDAEIVRHRGKIRSTIENAARALDLVEEFGSFGAYVWSWEPSDRLQNNVELHAHTPDSVALSEDLKRRGWSYVGPTTVYSFMQAIGLVNDHHPDCDWQSVCEQERTEAVIPQVKETR